jgi:hypothetical protein
VRTTASASVLFLAAVGCYNYQPLAAPTPAPGTRIEAQLTDAGELQMAGQIGPGATRVRGEVIQTDSDGLLLALTSVLGRNQQETLWNREQVRIPLALVSEVQQRRFALEKSIFFGGAVAGALFGAIKAFEGGGGGGTGGRGPGPLPQ